MLISDAFADPTLVFACKYAHGPSDGDDLWYHFFVVDGQSETGYALLKTMKKSGNVFYENRNMRGDTFLSNLTHAIKSGYDELEYNKELFGEMPK